MGIHGKTFATLGLAGALALGACSYPDGSVNRPGSGMLIGGLTGAAAGQIIGGNTEASLIGAALGAAVGGGIGASMAAQERELRGSLAGSGAEVTNTGTDLRVILPEAVTFRTDSSVVDSGFRPALRHVSTSLQRHPDSRVRVIGHTDNVGTAAYNNTLSQERAMAVARVLIETGTDAGRVSVAGRGLYEPVVSNATAAGRAQNRRVEIVITPNG